MHSSVWGVLGLVAGHVTHAQARKTHAHARPLGLLLVDLTTLSGRPLHCTEDVVVVVGCVVDADRGPWLVARCGDSMARLWACIWARVFLYMLRVLVFACMCVCVTSFDGQH